MKVLVVADNITDLTPARERLQEYLDISRDDIYYFCSAIEASEEIPSEIEQKLVKARDYKGYYEGYYNSFLGLVERTYFQLCEKFGPLYASCFLEFNIYDLSQYDVTALFMEYMRVHGFITHFCELRKIDRIIVLRRGEVLLDLQGGVYDYLNDFPVDSAVAEVVSKELSVEFIELDSKDNGSNRKGDMVSRAKAVCKSFIRDVCYAFLGFQELFILKPNKDYPDVLAFGSTEHLLSVLKEMKKVNVVYYNPTKLIKVIEDLRENNIRQICDAKNAASNRLKDRSFRGQVEKTFRQLNLNFEKDALSSLPGLLTFVFNIFCKHHILFFQKKVNRYEDILSTVRPKAVILDENVSALRKPFEFTARKMNIPTFVVNHGMPAKAYPPFINRGISDFSYIFVGGEVYEKIFTTYYGANAGKFEVTGTPRYDKVFKMKNVEVGSRGTTVCLAPALFLKRGTTYNFTDYVFNLKDNLKIVAEKQKRYNFKLVVKFHPGDPHEDLVRKIFNKECVKAEYITDQRTSSDVLNETDLVITCWSQIALEGVLLKKSVVIMNNYIGLEYPYSFLKDKMCAFAASPKDLADMLDEFCMNKRKMPFVDPKRRKKSLSEYEKFMDGGSSGRVAASIIDKIQREEGVTE